MTQEEKFLLLQDLCARLPYGVKVLDIITDTVKDVIGLDITSNYITVKSSELSHTVFFDDIKPYLRPMSSMTEEEKEEYRKTQINKWVRSVNCTGGGYYEHRNTLKTFDWLNANHFDFRNLIERELAIKVTEENNPY